MTTLEAIMTRHSYRGKYQSTPVSREDLVKILGVPEGYELICYLPVGVAAEGVRGPQKKAFEERAWFNGFPEALK